MDVCEFHNGMLTRYFSKNGYIWTRKETKMPNLFPDMSRIKYEGSEDFIFGAPIHVDAWKKLCELSECALNTAKSRYVRLPKQAIDQEFGITVILQQDFETDDDMLEAATWLRVVKDNRDRIYAVPYYTSIDLTTAMLKTIGAPRHLSVMFEVPTKEE